MATVVNGVGMTDPASGVPIFMEERDWEWLLDDINEAQVTPILGGELIQGTIPSRPELAEELAKDCKPPIRNRTTLARFAQFFETVEAKGDKFFPRRKVCRKIKDAEEHIEARRAVAVQGPRFEQPDEPHAILAGLNLPLYITTNYDTSMVQALKAKPHKRDAAPEYFRWTEVLNRRPSAFDRPSGIDGVALPTIAQPIVFHYFGHVDVPESLVLTEDHYLDFLINTSREDWMPKKVGESLVQNTLLFLGHRLIDLEFRVLLRSIASYLDKGYRRNLSTLIIQVDDAFGDAPTQAELNAVQTYYSDYLDADPLRIRLCPGTSREFLNELRRRRTGGVR
jgi:hypothetical protein